MSRFHLSPGKAFIKQIDRQSGLCAVQWMNGGSWLRSEWRHFECLPDAIRFCNERHLQITVLE